MQVSPSARAVNTLASMTARAVPSLVVVGAAASAWLTACAISLNTEMSVAGEPTVLNPHDASTNDASFDIGEATADSTAASTSQGNPLCNASRSIGGCYPDDLVSPMTANACTPDGGLADSGTMLACHVQPGAQGIPQAVCLSAGTGTDGTACSSPSDCAPGFECVVGRQATASCRPYCCSGQDRCASDDAGTGEFCDIQLAVSTQTSVPVCMPIHGCTLMNDGNDARASACNYDETCTIVSDHGATSCVAVGKAAAGESCDTDHCGANLACLGTLGQRHCYQLCLTMGSASQCPSSQMCKGGWPLFPNDTNVGLCQ
jgi:hypothetical protein